MRDETNEPNEALAEIVRELVVGRGRGRMNRIARLADIDNATLNKMMDGKAPRPEIVERVARAFPDLTERLYRVTGYEIPISLIPGVVEAAERRGVPAAEVVKEAVERLLKEDGASV